MTQQQKPQQELQQALDKHRKNTKDIDRILWFVLPVFALMLGTLFANLNLFSLLGTIVVLLVAFIAVGIKKKSLAVTLVLVLLYCLIDNYFSYQMQFNPEKLKWQLLMMILFIAIVGLTRTFFDRALMNQVSK